MNNFYLTLLSDSSLSTFSKNSQCDFKAAYSVTFDLIILELMFLFFKNTVK